MARLQVDVWSDIACPWCYVGKRHLEAALERLGRTDDVALRWRAFELDPTAPPVRDSSTSYVDRLARKYRVSAGQAQAMIDRMVATAAEDDLDFRFDIIRPGNTFDAHRLLHYAHTVGLQHELKERFLRGYMTEGAAIGDRTELQRMATEVGLDHDQVVAILESDAYAAEVRHDELQARTMSVSGVPFFLVGGRFGVPGAQPTDVMVKVFERAFARADQEAEPGDAASCGIDGC